MALRLALDANRYTDLARGIPEVVATVSTAVEVMIPFIVVGELRAGFRSGTRGAENERVLSRFLQTDGVGVLLPDEVTTHLCADLHAELRRAGTPIPTNDLWIAALAVQHDLVLYTRDQHFRCVNRLACL